MPPASRLHTWHVHPLRDVRSCSSRCWCATQVWTNWMDDHQAALFQCLSLQAAGTCMQACRSAQKKQSGSGAEFAPAVSPLISAFDWTFELAGQADLLISDLHHPLITTDPESVLLAGISICSTCLLSRSSCWCWIWTTHCLPPPAWQTCLRR